jgi:hypothetical protein
MEFLAGDSGFNRAGMEYKAVSIGKITRDKDGYFGTGFHAYHP